MKKLASLLICAFLLLCALGPALAEETAALTVSLPISLADYQKAYEAIIAENAPGCTVAWSSAAAEGKEAWLGVINHSVVGVMLQPEGESVAEVAVLITAELSEASLQTFLSLAGYCGAALLLDEDTDAASAMQAFMNEIYAVFTAISEGVTPEDICGLPGVLSISAAEDGMYQFYFLLNLTAADAAE